MKRTVFGVILMIIGAALIAVGTTMFAVSAQSDRESSPAYEQEIQVCIGEYFRNGDTSAEKITVSDSTITFADGTVKEYSLSIWKNMPETDEETGEITYRNLYFLKLDGDRLSYDPWEKEITIDEIIYKMAG